MSILTLPDAVERILGAVKAGQQGYVCVTGMHGIMEGRDDPGLQRILNQAFLCTPDGMPTVWLGRARGHNIERVYGPDLTLALMEVTRNLPVRHFFYGGAEGVAEDLKRKMQERFPGLQIVGTYCPPFRPLDNSEKQALCAQVEASGADILWVGLSTPKQERFMAEFLPLLPVKVMLGVGAAFDFHTGRARQAPRWMMRAGLEWFFRLVTEPRRLWRRYMIQVPRFASLVALDCLGLVSHSSDTPEMPKAFNLLEDWPKTILFAMLLLMFSTLVIAFQQGLQTALLSGFFVGIPLGSLLVSLSVINVCVEKEDRLDRLVPIALLLLFIWYQFFSIAAPSALLFFALNAPQKTVDIALCLGGISAVPLAMVATILPAIAIYSMLARHL